MSTMNPILNVDSYKLSHYLQYPPGTRRTSSYIEPRVGAAYDEIVFFGLQPFLMNFMERRVTIDDVHEAKDVALKHGLPFNEEGFRRIANRHDGRWPVEIQALPEGTVVRPGTPVVQIHNNDPELPWLPSFLETALLRAVWYPSTVATVSRSVRQVIEGYLEETGDPAGIYFKLHDFGARGASSREMAGLGGVAHLVNFQGTDTLDAIMCARAYYSADMAGFSIPASEHSTMTAWGRDHESEAFANMLERFGSGLVGVVSDSYDLESAVKELWGGRLHHAVANMPGGGLVVRPDSGDPVQTPVDVLEWLGEAFGWTLNDKGYKVLNHGVRVIQGDGMSPETIRLLLARMMLNEWSADNMAFGMGGNLLQHNRDDLRWAMKLNAIDFGQGWEPRNKVVKTDPSKSSRPGRVKVVRSVGHDALVAVEEDARTPFSENYLKTVYENGYMTIRQSLEQIRERARKGI